MSENEVIIFGAGHQGKHIARVADMLGIRIRAFVDNDPLKHGDSLLGIPILHPESLRDRTAFGKVPVIFIANKTQSAIDEIEEQLSTIKRFKILKSESDLVPFGTDNYKAGTLNPALYSTYIEITTTIGCSVACKMCPQSTLLKSYSSRNPLAPKEMSPDVFSSCVSKLPSSLEI